MRPLVFVVAAYQAWGSLCRRMSVSSVLNPSGLPSSGLPFTRHGGMDFSRANLLAHPSAHSRVPAAFMADTLENVVLQLSEQGEISPTRRAAMLALVASVMASQPSLAKAVPYQRKKPEEPAPTEVTIAKGVVMPTLALNTAGLTTDDTERALKFALQAGIEHVDFHPGIERDGVARVLKSNPNVRQELFLTTKIRKPSPNATVAEAVAAATKQIDEDLAALGLDSVDMIMLRDSPSCEVMKAQWKVLEGAVKSGKTRSIGVINYCTGSLSCILKGAKIKPAVNYYMLHPGMGPDAHGLRSFGEQNGVLTFAYGAYGEPGPEKALLTSPTLMKIAKARKISVEEVALLWALQSGVSVSVRPTLNFKLGKSACAGSVCEKGLDRRGGVFLLPPLDAQEMSAIDEMTSPDGNPTLFSSVGCPGPSPLRP